MIKEHAKEYFAHPAISRSDLVDFRFGPNYYRYWRRTKKETYSMVLGQAFHTFLLEPHLFALEYAVIDEGLSLATKAGKDWKARNGHLKAIKWDDYGNIQLWAESVRNHPVTTSWLNSGGEVEPSFYFSVGGIKLKARLDLIIPSEGLIIDFKTTKTLAKRKLAYECRDRGYDIQWGLYTLAAEKHFKKKFRFINVWILKTPPYDIRVTEPTMDDYNGSREETLKLIEELAECKRTDTWPSRIHYEIEPMSVRMIEMEDNYEEMDSEDTY